MYYNRKIIPLVIVVITSCKTSIQYPQCGEAKIVVYDSFSKTFVSGYQLYDVSNYVEGIDQKLHQVNPRFIYSDSDGTICYSFKGKTRDSFPRRFVFFKQGYGQTIHFILSPIKDTLFFAFPSSQQIKVVEK